MVIFDLYITVSRVIKLTNLSSETVYGSERIQVRFLGFPFASIGSLYSFFIANFSADQWGTGENPLPYFHSLYFIVVLVLRFAPYLQQFWSEFKLVEICPFVNRSCDMTNTAITTPTTTPRPIPGLKCRAAITEVKSTPCMTSTILVESAGTRTKWTGRCFRSDGPLSLQVFFSRGPLTLFKNVPIPEDLSQKHDICKISNAFPGN